jgi:hypothetical protein
VKDKTFSLKNKNKSKNYRSTSSPCTSPSSPSPTRPRLPPRYRRMLRLRASRSRFFLRLPGSSDFLPFL